MTDRGRCEYTTYATLTVLLTRMCILLTQMCTDDEVSYYLTSSLVSRVVGACIQKHVQLQCPDTSVKTKH